MEQLYLMSEIENFYPLSAFLRTGLENWINHHKSPNTMDVLQWAPRDSKVITKYINEAAVGYRWLNLRKFFHISWHLQNHDPEHYPPKEKESDLAPFFEIWGKVKNILRLSNLYIGTNNVNN